MVNATANARRLKAVAGLLNELGDVHETLLAAIEDKIAAMRRADTEQIKAAVEREQELVRLIDEKEGLRRQLAENVLRGYGISPAVAKRMSAAQFAARAGGPYAGMINAAAQRLKKITLQVAQRNHLAQLVSQNILRHLGEVFSAMTGGGDGVTGYSRAGGPAPVDADHIFDAVG